MLPLPAAPAHKCGRSARVRVRRGRALGGARARASWARAAEGTSRLRERGGVRTFPLRHAPLGVGGGGVEGEGLLPPLRAQRSPLRSPHLAPPVRVRAQRFPGQQRAPRRPFVLGLRAQTCGSSLGSSGAAAAGGGAARGTRGAPPQSGSRGTHSRGLPLL